MLSLPSHTISNPTSFFKVCKKLLLICIGIPQSVWKHNIIVGCSSPSVTALLLQLLFEPQTTPTRCTTTQRTAMHCFGRVQLAWGQSDCIYYCCLRKEKKIVLLAYCSMKKTISIFCVHMWKVFPQIIWVRWANPLRYLSVIPHNGNQLNRSVPLI